MVGSWAGTLPGAMGLRVATDVGNYPASPGFTGLLLRIVNGSSFFPVSCSGVVHRGDVTPDSVRPPRWRPDQWGGTVWLVSRTCNAVFSRPTVDGALPSGLVSPIAAPDLRSA
jgi:hypothetical protein